MFRVMIESYKLLSIERKTGTNLLDKRPAMANRRRI